MSVWVRSRLNQTALAVGGLAVMALIASLFFRSSQTGGWLYSLGFAAGLVAVVLAAGEPLHERHLRVTLLPRTALGWWALGLALFGVAVLAFAIVSTSVLRPNGVDAPLIPMFIMTITAFGAMIAAGVVTVLAWFRQGERSWLVLLTLAPAFFAVYFALGELVFPH